MTAAQDTVSERKARADRIVRLASADIDLSLAVGLEDIADFEGKRITIRLSPWQRTSLFLAFVVPVLSACILGAIASVQFYADMTAAKPIRIVDVNGHSKRVFSDLTAPLFLASSRENSWVLFDPRTDESVSGLVFHSVTMVTDEDGRRCCHIQMEPDFAGEIRIAQNNQQVVVRIDEPMNADRRATLLTIRAGGAVNTHEFGDDQFKDESKLPEASFKVRNIDLGGNPLVDDELLRRIVHELKPTQVHGIKLGKTRISDKGVQMLTQFTSLVVVELHGTGVTDDGLGELHKLDSPRFIKLQKTRVTETGVENLQKRFPGCVIESDFSKP